ncbi:hypothetical protein ABZP36_004471 [Zizania latifolia]
MRREGSGMKKRRQYLPTAEGIDAIHPDKAVAPMAISSLCEKIPCHLDDEINQFELLKFPNGEAEAPGDDGGSRAETHAEHVAPGTRTAGRAPHDTSAIGSGHPARDGRVLGAPGARSCHLAVPTASRTVPPTPTAVLRRLRPSRPNWLPASMPRAPPSAPPLPRRARRRWCLRPPRQSRRSPSRFPHRPHPRSWRKSSRCFPAAPPTRRFVHSSAPRRLPMSRRVGRSASPRRAGRLLSRGFRLHLPPRGSDHLASDSTTARIMKADMQFKDKFFTCLSLGEHTYRTNKSEGTSSPIWNSEKKVVVETNGSHIARISVFETNRFSNNTLVDYYEVDLFDMLTKDLDEHSEDLTLLDPSSSIATVGSISISCYIEDVVETEQGFARRVLAIVDYNEDGKLSLSEFMQLKKAFGNKLAVTKIEELFCQADTNGDGIVDMDELAALLADQQEKEPLISNCPVCGEILGKYDKINDMIHMTLCFDEGTGNQIMSGGFLTDKQASYGWMFHLSEWAHFSSYDVGLHSCSTASHILVLDRRTKKLVEEDIDGKIVLSMKALYQSKVGLTLIESGVKDLLKNLRRSKGKR